ncbi:MAG: MerR family transcriptional regulator [Nitrospirales bacterium]|nr:MerR family transcriptional regulator [Nitrospirales bacterium]
MTVQRPLGEKSFYKIGEVSAITELPASVLRFWESEFSFLQPKKSQGRHRAYDHQTIETILEIKRMLYEEGYTIMGVKRYWEKRQHAASKTRQSRKRVERAKNELQNILGLLDTHPNQEAKG